MNIGLFFLLLGISFVSLGSGGGQHCFFFSLFSIHDLFLRPRFHIFKALALEVCV